MTCRGRGVCKQKTALQSVAVEGGGWRGGAAGSGVGEVRGGGYPGSAGDYSCRLLQLLLQDRNIFNFYVSNKCLTNISLCDHVVGIQTKLIF